MNEDRTVASQSATSTTPEAMSPEDRKAIAMEILLQISSAANEECPPKAEGNGHHNNPFTWSSSQINTDLAMAAQCELEDDIGIDSSADGLTDLFCSPMYWKLRQSFVDAASDSNEYALVEVVWRAYNAGRLSPNRLTPDSPEVRSERHLQRHLLRAAVKTSTARVEA